MASNSNSSPSEDISSGTNLSNSICTIMKNRISHMNPPMPDSVCKEEMQSVTVDHDVIVEYITDA